MSKQSNNDLEQAGGCSCLMAFGIPVGMAIMGCDWPAIWPVFVVLVVVALILFIANVVGKKPSESPSKSGTDAVVSPSPQPGRQASRGLATSPDPMPETDDDSDDYDWDIDDFDDGDDDFDDTDPDYWYGDRGSDSQRRSGYQMWVNDDEFHDLKVAFRRLMRLLTKLSRDRKLRETVLGQASDRDTIVGQYGQKDFLVTLKLLLAKDVIYTYEQFGLDADMDFDTPEGQLLLALTLLLQGGEEEPTYKEFKLELLHDDDITNAMRDTHDEMWQVYRNSNVDISSEQADDFGLIMMLALVAHDTKYIPEMRSCLTRLAEVVANVSGDTDAISATLDEMRHRPQTDVNLKASAAVEKRPETQVTEGTIHDLNQLVGLRQVKTEVAALKHFIEVNKRRQEMGMKTPTVSYHCVFTGNPGTGKTTVARIVAGIYKDLGILSKGHLVETDRSGLVAEYVGQTAVKTNKIIDSALDGVLFVDEAYSLVAGGKEDYGKEAIATLLKRMEDDRDRLVVILAGYEDEMKQFVDSNPGLRSRFNRYIHFEDYSADELMQIFSNQLRAFDYTIDSRAETVLQQHLEQCVAIRGKDFGNARYVRNLFERTIEAQAVRLSSLAEPDSEALSRITEHDVTTALNRMSHQ